jgi:hypothetical protein
MTKYYCNICNLQVKKKDLPSHMRAHQIEEISAIYDRVEQGRIEGVPEVSFEMRCTVIYYNW